MALFADRTAAGRELGSVLADRRGTDAIVFGIPRGGIVVAAEVARLLVLPLAAVVVRKLGMPSHEEFAVGAIADGVRVMNEGSRGARHLSAAELQAVEDRERRELLRRTTRFGSVPDDLSGITALVVDDGVATGATALAACRSLRSRACDAVVLAVPVAPEGWKPEPGAADEFLCPHRERDFWAVGQFYDDFAQTSDAEVVELLSHDPHDPRDL
ncbi:MAG: phosphoribosyltransferase family protein [Microbacterium sp.]